MNAPDRFELFLLPDGVEKVTVSPDQRMPNAAFIKFEREDHTLGNMLVKQLQQDPRVLYAAYKVEHPLFANFVMRVQTEDGYTPRDALKNACQTLIVQLKIISRKFKEGYSVMSMLE
ncbi:DNA-directed RNA polymerase II core subunit [Starmerella bacillaris]|uniref:DNA-directed RNA polymerase II core subunit n=1 Tax=Starmerella bacillaris TaxID=1247836 RepID=A0AAV5RE89_STABA|nr:DNA-directed RNA polymerase II core subunit [Starmerella bacillaris]